MRRYEPGTPGTKRALLKSLFTMKPAKRIEEIEKNILRVEDIYARYEVMSQVALPADVKTVIMTELCTPELKEYLEFNNKDLEYKETREAIMAYVERKRRDPLTAMEVGNHEGDPGWWCEEEADYQYQDMDDLNQELNYYGYGGKGKGKSWAPKGKGKGPYKGSGKGGVYMKGSGKDKGKGKGKKGGFQGECHWCGKWGHTASQCSDKDEYMDWLRGSKGAGKNQAHQHRETNHVLPTLGEVATWKTVGNPVEMLVTESRHVDISNVNRHFPKLQNRYSVLTEEEVDYEEPMKVLPKCMGDSRSNNGETHPAATVHCCQRKPRTRWEREVEIGSVSVRQTTEVSHVAKSEEPTRLGEMRTGSRHEFLRNGWPDGWMTTRCRAGGGASTRWEKKVDIGSVGTCPKTEVSLMGKEDQIELTIDSGAGENVMPGYMAPYTPVTESKEAGVMYTAANGEMMPNRGCKKVRITTHEGQLRTMNMQITDVNRALMSVAKICDAGHTVTFNHNGGVIRNNQSGEETKFRRENNVYRMTVKLNEQGFARQG